MHAKDGGSVGGGRSVSEHGLDMEELSPATENPFPTTGLSLESR